MIITKLKGGIGNQMSQYAAGRALSKLLKTELAIDKSWFTIRKRKPHAVYFLDNFNIEAQCVEQWSKEYIEFVEKNYIFFQSDFLLLKDNTVLNGTWLSEKYFQNESETIKEDFTLKHTINTNCLNIVNNSVSLHIRRGDKVNHNLHMTLPLKYYYEAIELMTDSFPNVVFYIFSDDIEWAKNNLQILEEHYFFDHHSYQDCYKDLYLMSLCNHNIIANSSFSWWGAWLNTNVNKKIIAPKEWYNNQPLCHSDHYPSQWTIL